MDGCSLFSNKYQLIATFAGKWHETLIYDNIFITSLLTPSIYWLTIEIADQEALLPGVSRPLGEVSGAIKASPILAASLCGHPLMIGFSSVQVRPERKYTICTKLSVHSSQCTSCTTYSLHSNRILKVSSPDQFNLMILSWSNSRVQNIKIVSCQNICKCGHKNLDGHVSRMPKKTPSATSSSLITCFLCNWLVYCCDTIILLWAQQIELEVSYRVFELSQDSKTYLTIRSNQDAKFICISRAHARGISLSFLSAQRHCSNDENLSAVIGRTVLIAWNCIVTISRL